MVMASLIVVLSTVCFALGASGPGASTKSLHQAASDGDLAQVNLHIGGGADLNAPDADGRTPLRCAIAGGHTEVTQALVTAGANVNTRSARLTPLYLAARAGQTLVVDLLLANGADVNARDDISGTALHGAAGMGRRDIVQHLIEKGADVNAQTRAGLTPLAMAEAMGHPEVAEILRQHQATAPLDRPQNPYPQRDSYETMMPDNPRGIYGRPGSTLDVLSDPNAIRRSVASFPGLADTLETLEKKSKSGQRSWQQRRVDNRNSLLRMADTQFTDELAVVKTTAQQESAVQTVKAIDDLVTTRRQRYDAISDVLREERRAALQAEREAARTRGRSTTGTMTAVGRGRGRGMQTAETATAVTADVSRGRAARDPNAPPLDANTQAQLQAWQSGAQDKGPVLEAVTDADLRDLHSLRLVTVAEGAKQTTAAIEGLMLAHQERRERVLQRIADDEERQQRLEERANARGRGTDRGTTQSNTSTQGRGRRAR